MGILVPINSFISNSDMKRFLYKTLIYVVIILLIIVPVDFFKIYSHSYDFSVAGSEIYCAINNSRKIRKAKKLILGDSVGHQLYPCEIDYDSIVSLACNQAITLAGQYFLLKNYIENNVDSLPDEVVLFITPFSLCNDVDKYAYHYFLKPFPPHKWSKFYTKHLKQRIHSIPLYWSANLPFIQTSNYTPEWATHSSQSIKSISPLSYEYLMKMDSITKQHDVSFRMVSTPIRDDRQIDIESFWYNLPPDYAVELNSLLIPYEESVYYMPSDYYLDHVHFLPDKIPFDYLGLLK